MGEVILPCCRIEGGQYTSRITTLKNIAEKLGVDIKDIV
jgi:hypothetical protein